MAENNNVTENNEQQEASNEQNDRTWDIIHNFRDKKIEFAFSELAKCDKKIERFHFEWMLDFAFMVLNFDNAFVLSEILDFIPEQKDILEYAEIRKNELERDKSSINSIHDKKLITLYKIVILLYRLGGDHEAAEDMAKIARSEGHQIAALEPRSSYPEYFKLIRGISNERYQNEIPIWEKCLKAHLVDNTPEISPQIKAINKEYNIRLRRLPKSNQSPE